MAEAQGVGKDMVSDIWRAHNIQPHRTESFKLSRDPQFLEKLTDVVGLYSNPPERAIVLCVDEKSQIQALDRTQPGLPLKKGRVGTMTHDYKRNGTTCLFAALDVLQGKVIGQCYGRHRHQEFLKFLRRLDVEFPGPVTLHLVMDNYGTHQHPKVQAWLKRHRRFEFHFTPTFWIVAELGGALVRRTHQQSRAARLFCEHRGSGTCHWAVSRSLERQPKAVCMDCKHRIHYAEARSLQTDA